MAVDVASLVIRVSSLEAQSAARDLDRLSTASGNADRSARQMSGGFASVGSALKGMVAQLAAVAGVAALAQSFMAANTAAGMLRASLTTVTGSLETATKAWGALQNFAAQTPFSLEQSVQAFIKLKAMGLDPSQRALMSYGNTASAMGKNINQMIEAVADAATGEFERLKEFGIKAKVEGDNVSMTFQGVTTKIGNNAKDIEGYLMKIGETQFAGAMEAQAKTLGGALSNIGDAWDQLMVTLGDTGATDAIGESIAKISGLLTDLSASLEEGMPVGELGAQLAELEAATGGWGEAIAGIGPAWQEIFTQLAEMPNYVVSIRDGALAIEEQGTAWDAVKELIIAFGEAMISLPDNLQKAVYIILGEIDILIVNFETGMNTLPLYAKSAWDHIQNIILTAWVNIKIAVAEAVAWIAGQLAGMATKMAGFFASVPEEFDIGGVAASSAAQLNGLAASLNTTKAAVAGLKAEKVALGQTIVDNNGKLQAEIQTVQASGAAQVSAIRDTIQAGIADVDSKNQRRKAQAGVNAELAIAVGEEAKLNKQFDLGKAGQAAHTQATHAGAAAHKGAAKAANEQEKALDALIKKYLPARDDAKNLKEATAVLDKAMQDGKITGEEYGKMLKGLKKDYNTAENAAQDLIDKYDTEGAKARKLAEDQAALNAIIAEGGPAAERAKVALAELGKQQAKNGKDADAWAEVWKNAVKRIDDTFASLWKDLFSGTKSTLESMKNAILSWLAEVAHALLTKPLVVAITTAMTGGSAATQAAGVAGQAASGMNGLSPITSIPSMFSTAFQLGSTFLSGVSEGIMGMFSTNMFSTIGTAWGAATSGSAMGAAAGAGVIAAYALPLVAAGGLILSKYFKDQEPRYGAYGATTTGRTDQFEDEVGVKGGFGLTFGMNDMGTANVDAEEMRGVFEGFAKVSQALADFYGKDVEAAVKASLAKASMENWGKNGLMNYAMSAEQAFQIAFTDIIKHAAATGDAVAVVMSSVVGSLQGTLEQMADQIERGMLAAKAAVGMAEAFQGQEMGDRLGLADKDTVGNALMLVDYAKAMQQAGETTAEAMGRMALNLGVFDAALTLTGTTTEATGMAFIDLANGLADAADAAKIGMGGLMQLQGAYYEHFYTKEEQALKQKESALNAITRWNDDAGRTGDAAITTSAQFRAYVESLDLSTTAGQEAYVAAMKMVGGFISLDDALLKLGEGTGAVVASWTAQKDELLKLSQAFDDSGSKNSYQQGKDALKKAGYYELNTGEGQEYSYDPKYIAEFLKQLSELEDGGGEAGEELLKLKDVLLQMAEVARQKADLENQILAYTDPAAALAATRKLELEAMDESLRPLQERLWALQDEASLMDWVTNGAYGAAQAQARVAEAFRQMGVEMPATKAALDALILSGKLSAEQIAILSKILGDLKIVFPNGNDGSGDKNQNRNSANSGGGGSSSSKKQSKLPELELELLKLQEGAWAATLKQRELELKALTAAEAVLQKQIWALEDANRVRDLEIQLLQTQGKTWQSTLILRELELKDLSDAEKALMKLIWAQEDANRIRDLEIQLMELQGKSWQATLARRALELKGMSEAEKAIMKLIWAQEDANRIRDLETQLLEAQGKSWQATLAKRRLELKGLSDEEKALMKLIWAQEDANRIRDLETQLLEAQGKSWQATLANRKLELIGLSKEEQALMKLIWAQEDANRIRDLEIRLLEAQGRTWAATIKQRNLELIGLSKEEKALMRLIWAQEDASRRRELELRLMEAQGNTWKVTIARRNEELKGLSKEEQALMKLIWAQEDANRVRDLELRLMELQGRGQEALQIKRAIELLAMSKAEQAIQKQIWALEDEAAIREEHLSLYIRLAEVMGDDYLALQIKRQMELRDVSNSASRALLLMIYGLEDKKKAEEEAQAIKDKAAEEANRLAIEALEKIVNALSQLSDAIQSTIENLFPQAQVDIIMRRELAEAKIRAAVLAARAGTMPTMESLEPALNAVGKTEDVQFQTREAYLRRMGQTKADLLELGTFVQDKLTIEEQMLEELKKIPEETGASVGNEVNPEVLKLINLSNLMIDSLAAIDTNFDDKLTAAELIAALGSVASEESLLAYFATLDTNHNGLISALESLPLSIALSLKPMFTSLDTNLDKNLSFEELQAGLGAIMTGPQITAMMALMDTDKNGVISELEASSFSLNEINSKSLELQALSDIKTNISGTNTKLATVATKIVDVSANIIKTNQLLGYTQNVTPGELLLSPPLLNVSDNTNALVTDNSDIKTKLGTILNGTNNLSSIDTKLTTVNASINAVTAKLTTIDSRLPSIVTNTNHLSTISTNIANIATSNTSIATNTAGYSAKSLARIVNDIYLMLNSWKSNAGYATGGIASGPTSGYQATLHGTEAIIPLGDGNSVTAHLTAPLPNYIAQEAGDSPALRQALAELQEELAALRGDQRAIGAATVGELKDHNKRERKRDVVPQVVEVAP